MQIGKILFPVTTLGPGKRVGIWVLGCRRNCKGCSNPELQLFDETKDVPVGDVIGFVRTLDCEGATISGGEPFLQAEALKELVEGLHREKIEDILVYSGFTKEQLEQMHDPNIDYVLSHITVLIDGPFVEELVDGVPLRGSSNQRVWLFDDRYEQQYLECLRNEKKVDIFEFGDETHFIGIPFKNFRQLYVKYLRTRGQNE